MSIESTSSRGEPERRVKPAQRTKLLERGHTPRAAVRPVAAHQPQLASRLAATLRRHGIPAATGSDKPFEARLAPTEELPPSEKPIGISRRGAAPRRGGALGGDERRREESCDDERSGGETRTWRAQELTAEYVCTPRGWDAKELQGAGLGVVHAGKV